MAKRFYLLILVLLLTACSSLQHNMAPIIKPNPTQAYRAYKQLLPFTQVNALGRINLYLHTGYKKPQLLLRGDPRDLIQIKPVVNGTTLYLVVNKGFPKYGQVSADIQGKFLNTLTYKGAGIIKGTQLHTTYLELYLDNQGTTVLGGNIGLQKLQIAGSGTTQISNIKSYDLQIRLKDNPKVQLSGMVNLSKLDIEGNGWLSLYWLKSPHLIIKAKNASKIQLAGVVDRLEVELQGHAYFKGQYLRAKRSFVKTYDQSVAEIAAVHHQSTLAADFSNIYYYNLADTRADFMADRGSALDLRSWNQDFLKDFTRYNKQFP